MPFKSIEDEIEANERHAQEIADAKGSGGRHGVLVDTTEKAIEGLRRPVEERDEGSAEQIVRERLDNARDERDYEQLHEDFDKS